MPIVKRSISIDFTWSSVRYVKLSRTNAEKYRSSTVVKLFLHALKFTLSIPRHIPISINISLREKTLSTYVSTDSLSSSWIKLKSSIAIIYLLINHLHLRYLQSLLIIFVIMSLSFHQRFPVNATFRTAPNIYKVCLFVAKIQTLFQFYHKKETN